MPKQQRWSKYKTKILEFIASISTSSRKSFVHWTWWLYYIILLLSIKHCPWWRGLCNYVTLGTRRVIRNYETFKISVCLPKRKSVISLMFVNIICLTLYNLTAFLAYARLIEESNIFILILTCKIHNDEYKWPRSLGC